MGAGTAEKLLPLGSIIVMKGKVKKLMVVARGVMTGEEGPTQVFDYGAVLYPEGLVGDKLIFFNHEDIYKVVFEGYSDSDDEIIQDATREWLRVALQNTGNDANNESGENTENSEKTEAE